MLHTPHVLLLAAASLLCVPPVLAADTAQAQAHFLLLSAKGAPLSGATISGVCQSDDGSFFGGQRLQSPWSCTTGANGACAVDLTVLRKSSGQLSECKATQPGSIAEKGAAAQTSSFLTFFANGGQYSYNLFQKTKSWKHGEYYFSSFANREDFDAVALMHSPAYYTSKTVLQDDPASATVTLSTDAAHIAADKNYPRRQFLVASIDRQTGKPSLQLQLTDTYIDFTYHTLNAATYATPSGTTTVALTPVSKSANCTVRDLFERKCTYQETVRFDIDMGTARQLAARYQPDQSGLWNFSVATQSGQTLALSLSHAEFFALLAQVDDYLRTHPIRRK